MKYTKFLLCFFLVISSYPNLTFTQEQTNSTDPMKGAPDDPGAPSDLPQVPVDQPNPENTIPETPETPETPDLPDLPEIPKVPCTWGPNCPNQPSNNQKINPPKFPNRSHILLDSESDDLPYSSQVINTIEILYSLNSQLLEEMSAEDYFLEYNKEIFELLLRRVDNLMNRVDIGSFEDFMDDKTKEYGKSVEKSVNDKINYVTTQIISGLRFSIPDLAPLRNIIILNILSTLVSALIISSVIIYTNRRLIYVVENQ